MEHQNEAVGVRGSKKAAKRGRWSAEQRQQIVDASLVAGASISEVAERLGIRSNLLTAWRRRRAGDWVAEAEESTLAVRCRAYQGGSSGRHDRD